MNSAPNEKPAAGTAGNNGRGPLPLVYGKVDSIVKSTRVDSEADADPIRVFAKRELDHLSLARMGLHLIPLQSQSKHPPKGFAWKKYQDHGTTTEQVNIWSAEHPDCNWGLLLGRPSGVISVDVDSTQGFRWCELQGGFNREAPVWFETGRGWQWLFRLPEDLLNTRGVNPHDGVEIRANGQYSVVPPSIHPSGTPYTWRRPPESLESIPYAPQWVLDALTGQLAAVPLERPSPPLHQPKARVVTGPVELAGQNAKLRTMRGTRWLEDSTFPQGCRNQALYCYTLILKGAGLSKHDAKQRIDEWCQTRTRPVYGRFPDRAQEPHDAFEKTWNTPYSLQRDRLRALHNATGERMPESWAIELTRAYPSLKARSERVHHPQFATVAKILDALVKARAFDGKAFSHAQLARLARVSPHQVAKVAGFLTEIGIRTVVRRGPSTISTYSLKHLKTPPPQLIKHFARWRGYVVEWKVLAKRLWASIRTWMVKAFNAVNAVQNRVRHVWQGEEVCAEVCEAESIRPRGPPPNTRGTEALSAHQTGQINGLSGLALEGS